jgi:hypothetical protein
LEVKSMTRRAELDVHWGTVDRPTVVRLQVVPVTSVSRLSHANRHV